MRAAVAVVVAALMAAGVVAGTGTAAQAASPLNPVGSFDGISYDNRLRVSGWTFDPETAAPIDVHVYLDGRFVAVDRADERRPDVAAAYPSYGPSHGWFLELGKLGPGRHEVCVFAVNVGVGDANPLLGCRGITNPGDAALNPVGTLDQVQLVPEGLYLRGWTFDPETPQPIDVHVYIDGSIAAVLPAVGSRPDVGAVYPSYGESHGFEDVVTPPLPGRHEVCVYAINVGDGTTNPALGCRAFTVGTLPFGATATYGDGLSVAVGLPRRVQVSQTASPPPSDGYTGVLVEITVSNAGTEVFRPFESTYLLAGPRNRQAPQTSDVAGTNPDNRLTSVLPGESLVATFLFQVPTEHLGQLRFAITPDLLTTYASVFVGGVA